MERRLQASWFLRVTLLVGLLAAVSMVIFFAAAYAGGREDYGTGDETVFGQFVVAGGPIVWFVLLPISMLTAYLALEYFLTIRRGRLVPPDAGRTIAEVARCSDGQGLEAWVSNKQDLLSNAVSKAVAGSGGDWFRMRNLLFESLEEQVMAMVRKIEWLRLIGNVSPMIGLFGTVLGMIKLFRAIVVAGGQPQPAQLAGGISVALVTTFWGLLVAIPALAIHGFLNNRIETFLSEATAQAEDLTPALQKVVTPGSGAGERKSSIVEVAKKHKGKVPESSVMAGQQNED